MRKRINKALAVFMAVIIGVLPYALPLSVYAEGGTVTLRNTQDYINLAKKCKTDTWSRNRTVELAENIDLSKIDFTPIPTFGGIFKGNGYTISGVNIKEKGSYQGLFRYIQCGATVENLNVKGTVAPSGSRKVIGGIAGENSGIIVNCSFLGEVSGEASVGGICGYVTESGRIKSSKSYGSVSGKSYTGGICGQNFGIIDGCENNALVNTTDVEEHKSAKDLDIDLENIRSTENIDTNTDTGGICGYTKGRVYSCKNYGNVGYKSIGYNTGGICGRSAGYITGCENHGIIKGRKDIGGIAGQTEPYVLLEYTGDVLDDIRRTISDIRSTVSGSIDPSDTRLTDSLDSINSSVTGITDSIDALSDDVADYADSIIKSTNDLADRLNDALTQSEPAFNDLLSGIGKMSKGLGSFMEATDHLQNAVEAVKDEIDDMEDNEDFDEDISDVKTYLERALNQISGASNSFAKSITSLESGARVMKSGISELRQALENKKNIDKSFKKIWDGLQDVVDSLNNAGNSVEEIVKVLQELKNEGYLENVTGEVIINLKGMAECYRDIASAVSTIGDAILILMEDFDISSAGTAFILLSRAFTNLATALDAFEDAIDDLDISLNLKKASDKGEAAMDSMRSGLTSMSEGTDYLGKATDKLNSMVRNLREGGAFSLPMASDSLSGSLDGLIDSTRSIQGEFTTLNSLLSDKKSQLYDDINNIGDKLETLSDILMGAYEDKLDADKDDYYLDISDLDRSGDTRGKIENSQNYGEVNGDVNVGGTVGSMAIEYDFDPEDDVARDGKKTVNFTYKTKNVIRRCTNSGAVTAKKNYAGGIVGKMDLGSVMSCDNYGTISSTDGGYVGGIAGRSTTVIRNSAVKCELSGGDYIGGIAGEAGKITDCRTLVNVPEHGEFAGTIAGSADKINLKNNYFVNDALGGVDDINYGGVAEETDINGFVTFVKNGFGKDVVFTLRFIADDKEVAKLNFNYKDSIPEESIPKVPEKSGYYGKWSSYDFNEAKYDADITAEYHRNMDIISSAEKRADGKSVALVCGAFGDSAKISVGKHKGSEKKGAIDSCDIQIIGCYTDKYRVRYLPMSDKNVDIFVDYGDGPKKVGTKAYGSYLEFEASRPEFTIYELKKDYTALIVMLLIAAIMIAACIPLRRKGKNDKNNIKPI
ncbi:MAG: hypothetical protein PUE13_03545 [Clostridiales bacterium]|nr:hypothetical protein [Clostridiales bacterium]